MPLPRLEPTSAPLPRLSWLPRRRRLPPRPGRVLAAALLGALAPGLVSGLVSAPVSAAAAAWPGGWPLVPEPSVVAGFDPPGSPWGAGHRGVDLLGHPGQAVHAAGAGTVRYAGMLAGRPVVVVDDGTTRTTYEPVEPAPGVALGVAVAAGTVLGRLRAAPSHCAPRACLHWGWIRDADDAYLDPLGLLGSPPVRLLPLGGSPDQVPVAEQATPPAPGPAPRPAQPDAGSRAAAGRSGVARALTRWW